MPKMGCLAVILLVGCGVGQTDTVDAGTPPEWQACGHYSIPGDAECCDHSQDGDGTFCREGTHCISIPKPLPYRWGCL